MLQKIAFYRQKTHNYDKCTGKISVCDLYIISVDEPITFIFPKNALFEPDSELYLPREFTLWDSETPAT